MYYIYDKLWIQYIYMLVQPRRNVCFVITCLAKDNTLSIATNS
jgi:hypothetical protein